MKKNIEIINAGSPLLTWAVKILQKEIQKPDGAKELIDGMTALRNGSCSSLMIECEEQQEYIPRSRQISCGDLTIDPDFHRVVRDGKELSLTPKEFDILYFLAQNRGIVFTKEQIYQAVWDNEYLLDDSNIMAFIRKIRKKIEPNPDAPQYILTIWGIGYKFNDTL